MALTIEEQYKRFVEALQKAGRNDPFAMTVAEFENWVSQGPMKGDGKRYLVPGVWPRFRDIADRGRLHILGWKDDPVGEPVLDGWYWFSVAQARDHYGEVQDPDFLYGQAAVW